MTEASYSDEATVLGTRFLLHAQAPYVPGYQVPEVSWIRLPPGDIGPGPSDSQMYVVDPVSDKAPYQFPELPPYGGLSHPPVEPGADGHFDHLDPGSRQFVAAHAYASVRRVIEIWESYLGAPLDWHFAADIERLEIIPRLDWPNAQAGYGFLELGLERMPDGRENPLALNFDVVAHEVGHVILFSLFGMPETLHREDFAAFHESSADLVSLISFLHFDTGMDRLLNRTQGNLLTLNELNQIGELEGERQIRIASNARRMSEVTAEIHDRSRPFTGAVFDGIVELYHAILVERGLVDERLLELDLREFDEDLLERITRKTADAYRRRPVLFKSALIEARDVVGLALADTWRGLDPEHVNFASAAENMLDATDRTGQPAAVDLLEASFQWREIL